MALHELNWYIIAVKLRDFLKKYRYKDGTELFKNLVDRQDLIIKVGAGNVGEFPAIWILYGSEEGLVDKPSNYNGGLVQLWVDMYIKGAASNDEDADASCYGQLNEVQNEITKILPKFQNEMARQGMVMVITPQAVLSDGDVNAPATVMARYVIDIEWRKSNFNIE